MKNLALIFLFLLLGCSHPEKELSEVKTPSDSRVELMKAYLKSVKTTYLRELKRAVEEGNEEKMLKACGLPYENEWREVRGVEVAAGRTGPWLRNPLNAPEPWMKEWFESMRHGKDEVFIQLSEGDWAYLENIRVEAVCLKCHSSQASSSVKSELQSRYLQDQSMDFSQGDWMGIYWVRSQERSP